MQHDTSINKDKHPVVRAQYAGSQVIIAVVVLSFIDRVD